MAKPLDPKELEAARGKGSRKARREQIRQSMREEIAQNKSGSGVVIIQPAKKPYEAAEMQKTRVAAYCRVSTQEEQQVGSFDMQVLHFQLKIENNPDWDLVEIYKDEGISGTSTIKRIGFQGTVKSSAQICQRHI